MIHCYFSLSGTTHCVFKVLFIKSVCQFYYSAELLREKILFILAAG